jgi:outer membrane protein OmpA-like peptidoglycan-associated protein
MNRVDAYAVSGHGSRKPLIALAREAVQTAEDAREIAVKKMDDVRLDNERQAAATSQAQTQAQADDATRQKNQAQLDRDQADIARNQAQSDTARAQVAQAQAETDTANANAQAAQARADSNQAQSDMANNQANSAAALSAAHADTDQAKSDMANNQANSAAALSAAQADADQSRLAAQQAQANAQQSDNDKTAMRVRLSEQLNKILETRDTARGLIVSMSDVLFDTGKYSLKPGAREKLAKVAGILLAYPGLNIAVGGYTDNVGADAMNQTLSENRAGSVRDYLVSQGVATASVTAAGFGNTLPVATNDNAAGRQQNRRVELLVSGEAIGNPMNTTTGSLR